MDKIKVCLYLSNMGLGGTEKSALLCFRGLNKAKFDVTFVTMGKTTDPRYKEFLSVFGNKMYICAFKEEVVAKITNINPDVVQVYRSGFEEFPVPGRNINVKYFCEVNVFGGLDPNHQVSKSLFMSEWLMKAILAQYPPLKNLRPSRWDYLNNPVDMPYTSEKLDLGVPEGTIILGRCGRPDDGIYDDIAVKAAYIAKSMGVNPFYLVVAPPPRMIEDLKKYNIAFQAIEPTINPFELSKFYNTLDIYAHFRADGETFGSNIAEAMIHRKPVITHLAVPSHSGMGVFQAQTQLVSHHLTGYVATHDARNYADALIELANNPDRRIEMGKRGYAKILTEAHTPVVVQKLERIYTELINA